MVWDGIEKRDGIERRRYPHKIEIDDHGKTITVVCGKEYEWGKLK